MKYLLLALIVSGSFTLESGLCRLAGWGTFIPDVGLLFILVYAGRGSGKLLVPLCFLCGWIRGIGCSDPAGFYVLVYMAVGFLMFKTRMLFFMDRPLTQVTLSLLLGALYWICYAAAVVSGLLPHPENGWPAHQLFGCLSAACLSPLAFLVYDRSKGLRRALHP